MSKAEEMATKNLSWPGSPVDDNHDKYVVRTLTMWIRASVLNHSIPLFSVYRVIFNVLSNVDRYTVKHLYIEYILFPQ